jgi:hypothetical protein
MGPRRPTLSTAGRRAGHFVVVAVAAAGLAACGAADNGRSGSSSASSGGSIPAALVREARPIGRGARFQPPARGPVIGPCRRALGRARGVHVEVFAANRVVLIPAGIGTKPPRATFEGRISKARCFGDLVTLEPTGVVLVRSGASLTLADLFKSWGQPLSRRRLASFGAAAGQRVAVFVGGRPWHGRPGAVPLRPHAEIVLEVGPHVPPHSSYTFPPGT